MKSTITIDVELDEQKVPQKIEWSASESTADEKQQAKALLLSLWDSTDKAALRIDLWTKDMMIDEMADFFYQTMMTMADTFGRATQQEELQKEMKDFAIAFYKKFQAGQLQTHKAT